MFHQAGSQDCSDRNSGSRESRPSATAPAVMADVLSGRFRPVHDGLRPVSRSSRAYPGGVSFRGDDMCRERASSRAPTALGCRHSGLRLPRDRLVLVLVTGVTTATVTLAETAHLSRCGRWSRDRQRSNSDSGCQLVRPDPAARSVPWCLLRAGCAARVRRGGCGSRPSLTDSFPTTTLSVTTPSVDPWRTKGTR